ncbi:MAG: hypothetical protein KDA68_21525, partial [Planctomycetaceae bacterium]|nr:hypothetical protein [Planctomycetaceae bacterium]
RKDFALDPGSSYRSGVMEALPMGAELYGAFGCGWRGFLWVGYSGAGGKSGAEEGRKTAAFVSIPVDNIETPAAYPASGPSPAAMGCGGD